MTPSRRSARTQYLLRSSADESTNAPTLDVCFYILHYVCLATVSAMASLTENEFSEDFGFIAPSASLLDNPAVAPSDFELPSQNLHSHPSKRYASLSTDPATNRATPSKKGARINKEAIRILKTWFFTHENKPYPRHNDLQFLQQQTGLEHKQITTWFSNARRRGLSRDSGSKHPQVHDT